MMEQRTPEWFEARRGKVTASRIADLMAQTKTGWGASRSNYMADLIAERLTGQTSPSFSSTAMKWGTDTEPEARANYAFISDVDVIEVGFIPHPTLDAGASPDGLVGLDGMVEIKCPNTNTHIDYLLGSGIPDKYVKQMQFQMACADRQWCDYVSYDPRMPPDFQIKIERVKRDDKLIGKIEAAIKEFLGEMEEKIQRLEEICQTLPK